MPFPQTNRYWTLAATPAGGLPTTVDFVLRQAPTPSPGPGQALTRTIYISLDPYQWGYRRRGVEKPGEVCHARTVSQVVESRMDGFAPGDLVFNTGGWAEYALMGEGVPRPAYMIPRRLDPAKGRISLAVGVLGMLGLTAYAGMTLLAAPRSGETAVVSAASGGVGQIAGQLARIAGARVVGVAGAEAKCRFVERELGFDACVSHLSPTFAADLAAACPAGIDVYFENVGGAHMEAALMAAKPFGRFALCGMISEYNNTDLGQGVRGLVMAVGKSLTLRGFIVSNHTDMQAAFVKELAGWVAEGKFKHTETVRKGIENAPAAFLGLFKGENLGKMLVKLN